MRKMKLMTRMGRLGAVLGLFLAGWLVTGCETTGGPGNGGGNDGPEPITLKPHEPREGGRLRTGDLIRVEFSGLPPNQEMAPHEEQIKDDGTITLQWIGSVQAARKTTGELQADIRNSYLQYYERINVVVRADVLFYTVGGEVKQPSRYPFRGDMKVMEAIKSAGDFTDFAQRRRVQVIRANGERLTVNANDILRGRREDPPLYAGDMVHVPRRVFY